MSEEQIKILPDGGVRDGRTGRFVRGHNGGPGQGHVSSLRRALQAAVTVEDMHDIMRKLVSLAKDGDVDAAKLVFDRLFGKSPSNLKLTEEKSVNVQIRNLSDRELADLEKLALKTIEAVPAEFTVKEGRE